LKSIAGRTAARDSGRELPTLTGRSHLVENGFRESAGIGG